MFGITGALIMGSTSSCKKDKDKDKHNQVPSSITVPAGYNGNDYKRIHAFFEQQSSDGKRTNLSILKTFDKNFDSKDPSTWMYTKKPTFEKIENGNVLGILFTDDKTKPKQVEVVNFNCYRNPNNLSGNLDLTGCDALNFVSLCGTHINQVNPKSHHLEMSFGCLKK